MPVYVIAHVNVRDWPRFKEYQRAALPTIARHEGKVIAAGPAEPLEGQPFVHNVVIEFPSEELAKRWYHCAEYQAALPIREESGPGGQLCIVNGLERRPLA